MLSVVVFLALSARFPQASDFVRPLEPVRTDADLLLNLARTGKVEAQILLGEYFLARREYAAALPWLRLAADQGDMEAQRLLALMYELGQGVPRDYKQAAAWLRCAAEQGDSLAYYKEGFCYTTSAGIP